ncbi:type VI secretion system accessory protein TagJ [Methylobacter luteus]|uniref:type VI secretion system accessory protein TagJ n=1 Tax=Methylobacter luteus TaxID=415 RepID=UPI0003FED76F|nr:type VI secretion system accessory protein TagJ [Methylobacter luteus]
MKLAEQHLQEGRLQESLAALQSQVRKDPANPKLRTFLFQLLTVLGEWDRALTQLTVAGELDAANLPMVQTYREAIRCEVLRKEIFSGHKTPVVFGDPAQWIALLQEALKLTAENRFAEARNLRDQAFDLAPVTPGSINGDAFNWIADADTRLGPMLEAIVNGRYYWVPFHQIREIHIEEPADLRDFVWMPAHFTWTNGGEAFGLIPTRYPGSETADEPAIRLARKTQWQELAEETFIGLGQRLLSTGENDYAVMDVREIKLNVD